MFVHRPKRYECNTSPRIDTPGVLCQEKERLANLSGEVQRVSQENAALLEELKKVKSSKPVAEITQDADAPEEPKPTTEPICNQEDIPVRIVLHNV